MEKYSDKFSKRDSHFDVLVKVITIGDSGVGKTCMILRTCDNKFSHSFITTIGIDFKTKNFIIKDKKIKLQIWDTAGQERFRNITTSYIRGSDVVLLVYDVTCRESFEQIVTWNTTIDKVGAPPTRFLVGNKIDIIGKRVVTTKEGKMLAEKYGMSFYECSAKTDPSSVEIIFEDIANIMTDKFFKESNNIITIKENKPRKTKC